MNDQVALAEAHAGLELVGELTACAQFGDGWSAPNPRHPMALRS